MSSLRGMLPVLLILAAPPLMLYTLWANPLSAGEDDVVYYYPLRVLTAQCLRDGVWGETNPFEAGGAALMADPQAATLFPATWLFVHLDGRLAYTLSIFVAFWVAGLGALAYLRRLGLVAPAAVFGAMAFMFCGFMVGHRVHLAMIQTASLLPWGLWCIEAARESPSRAFAVAAPVVFLTVAAGHWPTLLHMGVVWAAYLLLRGRPLPRSAAVLGVAAAVGLALAAPQIVATAELLQQVTRARIGYATAGENSFFPAAGMLALFPMIFGSRTPGVFPQSWWGPWHLCEMLGYVGLVALALAGAAVWKLFRKKGDWLRYQGDGVSALHAMVRAWTWILAGGMIWMLGYYLPTYRLIHMLPVLGVLRCPARMVLAVDLGLATLAAIAVHVLITCRARSLGRSVRRAVTVTMPVAMAVCLAALAAAAWALRGTWTPNQLVPMGGAEDALKALRPSSPAVWTPIALMAITLVAVRLWLRSPRRLAAVLVVLLLADLGVLTRFVDVPPDYAAAPPPEASPAADWLAANAPAGGFRVYGLSKDYNQRPAELLLPKTAGLRGVATIANYGPFQSPTHAQLFGFRPWGLSRRWPDLLRRNALLSLYGVRYILAEAGSEHEQMLQSVRIPDTPPPPDGPDLLSKNWTLSHATLDGPTVRLRTSFLWMPATATQALGGRLRAKTIYRIALDARGPDDGAANFLQADLGGKRADGGWSAPADRGLVAEAEQIGPDWRHFEWTFQTGDDVAGDLAFRLLTMSERPIEVRNVSLRPSAWPAPVNLTGLAAGQRVYPKAADLPPLRAGDPNVVIYANRLWEPGATHGGPATPAGNEWLRWRPASQGAIPHAPDLALRVGRPPAWTLGGAAVPAGAGYLAILAIAAMRARRRAALPPGL